MDLRYEIKSIERWLFRKKIHGTILILISCLFLFSGYVVFNSIAPSDFPESKIVSIKQDTYLSSVASVLYKEHIIKSAFFYKVYVVLLGGSKKIMAGDYLFNEPQSILGIAERTIHGNFGIAKVKVTIYEGMTVANIAEVLVRSIPKFDKTDFLAKTTNKEGYLFPDTYFFFANATVDDVIDVLTSAFEEKTNSLSKDVRSSGKLFSDVIKMASIVEREATSTADREIIAGILWKRIARGMALQVDPPFHYTIGKTSSDLTLKDLASDSPYNTYTHKGLPPTPISNPGLNSILATLHPKTTDYFFYLSDSHGNMHYAATHDGHLANKEKYVR
jgi:UPF0755 protein